MALASCLSQGTCHLLYVYFSFFLVLCYVFLFLGWFKKAPGPGSRASSDGQGSIFCLFINRVHCLLTCFSVDIYEDRLHVRKWGETIGEIVTQWRECWINSLQNSFTNFEGLPFKLSDLHSNV